MKEVNLGDGTVIYIFEKAHVDVLVEIAENRLWMNGAKKRLRWLAILVGFGTGGLTILTLWWPWISRMVGLIIEGVPT